MAETWEVAEEKLRQEWSPACTVPEAQVNKFRDGWKNAKKYELAMSGSINMLWLISKQAAA